MSKAIKLTIGAVALTTSLASLWIGAQVSQTCRAHEIKIVRTFTDPNATTQLFSPTSQILWQEQSQGPVAAPVEITLPKSHTEPHAGRFTVVSTFADETRSLAQSQPISGKDLNLHIFTLDKTNSTYKAEHIGMSFGRTLSCIDGE